MCGRCFGEKKVTEMGNSNFSILLKRRNQQRKLRTLIRQSLMLQFVIAWEGKMTLIATSFYEENGYLHDYEFLDSNMGFHT